jgi:nucleoside phosphorylase
MFRLEGAKLKRPERMVLIMTALGVEYLAVKSHLSQTRTLVHPAGTVYEYGEFEENATSWGVVICETGAGNNIAAIETSRALDAFQPMLTIFVGVAGGLKNVDIGDVVVADHVYGYESSKMSENFQSRIKSFGCGYPLVCLARAIRKEGYWHKRILQGGTTPRAFVGPIASGEQVLDGHNTPTHQLLEQYCGDAYAVEMEGWGFLFAAHASGDIPAIVIRGISDMTINKNLASDIVDQPVAAAHAAAFAFELLAAIRSPAAQEIKTSRPWRPVLP